MTTGDDSRLLLDTHAFLWLATGDPRVDERLRGQLADPSVELLLSVASIWEMAIKKSLGKLAVQLPLQQLLNRQCEAMVVGVLDIRTAHALAVESLPFHHRDPFDRLLVAQALTEGVAIVSRDQIFDSYSVPRLW